MNELYIILYIHTNIYVLNVQFYRLTNYYVALLKFNSPNLPIKQTLNCPIPFSNDLSCEQKHVNIALNEFYFGKQTKEKNINKYMKTIHLHIRKIIEQKKKKKKETHIKSSNGGKTNEK